MNHQPIPARLFVRLTMALTLAGTAAMLLPACAPLLLGGAMIGGTLMAIDRRTSGAQVEDQAIELKAGQRAGEASGNRGHINVTSYNRLVLLTGEVATEAERTAVEQAVARVENVRSIVNELALMGNSSLTARSSDAIVSGRVKAAFIDTKELHANALKVVTERGTTYLMGRVTEREALRATEIAREISGVQKVVRVFELISEQELADLQKGAFPAR